MNNKVKLGIVIFSSVGVLLNNIYKAITINKQETQNPGEASNIIQIAEISQLQSLQQLLAHKSQRFQLQYLSENPSILTQQCIINFLYETNQFFSYQQIQQIYDKNREGRRKLIKQSSGQFYQQYFRFIYTLEEEIQYLIEKIQKDFTVFLGINYGFITESINYHINNPHFNNKIQEWNAQLRDHLKQSLITAQKPVDKQQIKLIINYQLEVLKKDKDNIKQLLVSLSLNTIDMKCIPAFLITYLDDCVYFKYGIERQQLSLQPNQYKVEQQIIIMKQELDNLQKQTIQQICDNLNNIE